LNSVKISDGAMLPRCHDDATSVTGRVARSIVLIHCSRWATELNTEGDAHVADMSFVQRSDDRVTISNFSGSYWGRRRV